MGEGKISIYTHGFLHVHSHSVGLDRTNYVPDLVYNQVLKFTVANEADMVPALLEQWGR